MQYLRRIPFVIACLVVAGFPSCYFFAKRGVESDVRLTVEEIRLAEVQNALTAQTLTNLAVGSARILVRSVAPLEFTVSSMTPWPDAEIYQYDSWMPEKGIYHYSF